MFASRDRHRAESIGCLMDVLKAWASVFQMKSATTAWITSVCSMDHISMEYGSHQHGVFSLNSLGGHTCGGKANYMC